MDEGWPGLPDHVSRAPVRQPAQREVSLGASIEAEQNHELCNDNYRTVASAAAQQ